MRFPKSALMRRLGPKTAPPVTPPPAPTAGRPPTGGGLRFNPNMKLDPSQVEDRRGDLPPKPQLNRTTTTGTIPQNDGHTDNMMRAMRRRQRK